MRRLLPTRQRELIRPVRRLLVSRLHANATGHRILANSVPKAGTHLLTRCLSLLPGITDSELRYRGHVVDERLEAQLNMVNGGCFVPVHLTYSDERARLLTGLGFKMALIIRDPRDIVVSHFHYVTYGSRRHRLHAYYTSLPDDQTRLMVSITGVLEPQSDPKVRLLDIDRRCRGFLKWEDHGACVVKFESLVGPHGGGTYGAQRVDIERLAEHVGVQLDEMDIESIASRVYDRKSSTFRKGKTGDWKNHLTPEHKEAFKRVAGDLLIDLGYERDLQW